MIYKNKKELDIEKLNFSISVSTKLIDWINSHEMEINEAQSHILTIYEVFYAFLPAHL
jgi:hypothetical protein